ncbi:MAG: hypothetical protein ACR2H4_21365 [Pyrinomonadaceae bacterium]
MTLLRPLISKLLVVLLISSTSGAAFGQRVRQKPQAASISFDNSDPKLTPKQTVRVKATVLDQYGHVMPDAKVIWENVDQPKGSPLSFSGSLESANTLVITANEGNDTVAERITTRVTAVSGDASHDLTVVYESTPKPVPAKITLTPEKVDLDSDGETTINAALADADDKALHGNKVTWALAKPELSEFVSLGTVVNDKTTNSITLIGRVSKKKTKAPDVITLLATAGNAVGVVTINYKAPPDTGSKGIITSWSVVPPRIVGDNFGRTIMHDYYCVEVAIDNHSDSDIALGSLSFQPEGLAAIPTSAYPIVQGSLARRKLTHPRAITVAAIDAMGSLLTGFNPFFHNINHAKNYSQFIDILSNPLAKGVASVWKDSYPDEMARFEANVLKDDKIITKDAKTFKTIVFVEKRNLYPNNEKDRDDPIKVKAKLKKLIVMGQKIQQGRSETLSE